MKKIYNLAHYPDNGDHQECDIGLPFEIVKGRDGYYWTDRKGIKHTYNILKSNKTTNKWIVHLKVGANESLFKIFNIMVNKDVDKIIEYCRKIYKKSLIMEIARLQEELKTLE
jgi:hypothetical protein